MLQVDLRVDGILHIVADGVLTTDAYAAFAPRYRRLAKPGSPILLELGPSFTGWGPGALWRGLKPDADQERSSGRLAVVGDRTWREWSTVPANLFFPGEISFFELGAMAEAVAWLLEAQEAW